MLPNLLLPLAGPEELDDDEMQKLPIDLQYLSDDKKREPQADLRIILLESLLQVCKLFEFNLKKSVCEKTE